MLPLSHSDWVAEAPNLPSEALVFLIRQIGNGDPMIYGYLFQQLGRRIAPLARRATRGLDRETARELVLRIIERPIKMAPDHRSSPEEIVIALQDESRRKEWFRKACNSVKNPLHREVVLLHHVEGMSVPEIAQKLPARPAQVKYWLTAGLKVMRKALGVEPEGEKQ
jgi:DNA-directed RNA polymerase specialized sigma24 family protein